jgi:ribonucleoside-diphosphate reductase alpha chain
MEINANNTGELSFGALGSSYPTSAGELKPFVFERYFTQDGKSPFEFDLFGNPMRWVSEEVKVTDDMGKVVFTQQNVRRPDFWSPLAIKVVASKYFWGDAAKGEREHSIEQLIGRVSRYVGRQAIKQKYMSDEQAARLRDEVAAICLHQLAVFNSPVWFNAGIQEYDKNAGGVGVWKWSAATDTVVPVEKTDDRPQCSACFIQSTEDSIESILALQYSEAMLFKAGSGTGTNRSPLRSCREKLTGGGRASGPVSFMKGYDAYAAIIKSGGKTRRAAKMEILNVDHPDIIDFIESKQKEERKAWALIEQGYAGGMNGDAYGSIAFQNCNMSVRAPDSFMTAVKSDGEWQTKFVKGGGISETFKAREVLHKIAEGTHICGDPGMQFDTTINTWHTCKNSGRINASNPCSEYMFLDDSACNLASINLMKFRTENGKFDVEKFKRVVKAFSVAMDLFVDGSSYPTAKIARNSRDFRPLGLGYANLGALLMSLGLSYDSDEGRAVSAAITAIMCGEAYKTSAELASSVGPFPGFAKNREPMLEVMHMHRDAVKKIEVNKMPAELRYLVNEAWDCWDEAVKIGEKHL